MEKVLPETTRRSEPLPELVKVMLLPDNFDSEKREVMKEHIKSIVVSWPYVS